MEYNEIINELATLKFKQKIVYNKDRTLAQVKKFSHENLMLYYEKYHKYEYQPEKPKFTISTFKNYRSKILDFIGYCQKENINIYKFTQSQLEDYFKKETSSGTLNVRKTVVEQLLIRCSVILDYSKIIERIKELKDSQKKHILFLQKK